MILHIETSTLLCSVALSEKGKCLALVDKDPKEYIHGEFLTLFIEEVMSTAKRSLQELDAVSVSIGPGSYTGLRIGLSVAKGICFGQDIPLISIGSLDCLLQLGRMRHPNKTLCAVMDARRMEVYSKMTGPQGDVLQKEKAVIIDENSFRSYDPFVYFGDGAEKLKEVWSERNSSADSEIMLSASGQIQLAYDKYRRREFEDLAYSKPLYLKEFGAK